jgi:hypothetical protein
MQALFRGGAKVLSGNKVNGKEMFGLFIGMVIWLVFVLFLGRWLWNNILIKLIPGIKPITSIWQILGLSVLISLLTGF